MGLFSGAKELNRFANSVSAVKQLLDMYEQDPDESLLLVSAWLCKVGVMDAIERNNWPIYNIFYVEIGGHMTKMTIAEGIMHTTTRLNNKIENIFNGRLKRQVSDILDGGPSFDEIDKQIPDNIRNITQ